MRRCSAVRLQVPRHHPHELRLQRLEVVGIQVERSAGEAEKVAGGGIRHPSGARRLVSMQRGMPLLRLETVRDDIGFDEILLSTPEAAAIAERIQTPVTR